MSNQLVQFKQVEDAACITVANGVYTPRQLYVLGERLFVKVGTGYQPIMFDQGEYCIGHLKKRMRVIEVQGVELQHGRVSFSDVTIKGGVK